MDERRGVDATSGRLLAVRVDQALARLGGVASARDLARATSRRRIRTALARGDIVRSGTRGYALANADAGLRAARELSGVASHLSAARHWGWKLAWQPERPNVIVPRSRQVARHRRGSVHVRWRDLSADAVHDGWVTTPVQTVIDCARDLPFPEALAVADSALRSGLVTAEELLLAAQSVTTRGRAKALRVARHADARPANPFESVLRALAIEAGLPLEPQVVIDDRGFTGRPDLLDRERRLVVEADSFEFHGNRKALHRDCRRYTALTIRGWTVLRFSWEDVFLHPGYVRACLRAVAEGPGEHAILTDPRLHAA